MRSSANKKEPDQQGPRVPASPFVDDDGKTVKGNRSMLDDANDGEDNEEEKDWW